jgi:subtilisin family serine protease
MKYSFLYVILIMLAVNCNTVFGQSSNNKTTASCSFQTCSQPKLFMDSNLFGTINPVPNRYIVVFNEVGCNKSDCSIEKEEVTLRANALSAKYKGKIFYYYYRSIKGFAVRLDTLEAARKLSKEEGVKYVEQDARGETDSSVTQQPLPVSSSGLWGLDRIDNKKKSTGIFPLITTLITDKFYEYQNKGTGVNVYVIDTGIASIPGEFENRVSPFFTATGDAVTYSNISGYIPTTGSPAESVTDQSGHGTHVAGIIGSDSYGVAKNTNIFSVRVDTNNTPHINLPSMEAFGAGDIIAGIQAVINAEVMNSIPAVVNISLKTTGCSMSLDNYVKSLPVQNNITVVVGAGNDTQTITASPARVLEAITVGASSRTCDVKWKKKVGSKWMKSTTCFYKPPYPFKARVETQKDIIYWGSNFGCQVDVFAPGDKILSTWAASPFYNTKSGTSQTAPFVSGVVALLLESEPNLTPQDIEDRIKGNSGVPTNQILSNDNVVNHIKSNTTKRLIYKNPDSNSF